MSKLIKLELTNEEIYKLCENQQVLISAALAGETHKELAFNFGLPIGTVKSRLSRATAKLLENRKNAAAANIDP